MQSLHRCHPCTTIIVTNIMLWPGGCLKWGRRTYLGLGSKRRFPRSHLPRSFRSCHCINSLIWFTCLGCNYLSTSGYIWALHDPGDPLPMQSRIIGCLWRRHTSGSLVQNLGVNYFRMTQVHKRLQDDLATISSLVKGRGGDYDYLDPENVACSIDIWTLHSAHTLCCF